MTLNNRKMEAQTTPAGLIGNNLEAFYVNGEAKVIRDGKVINVVDSIDTLQAFRGLLESDKEALQAIEQLTSDPIEQVIQFIYCRYGDFDKRADWTPEGVTVPEYWDCGLRGKCLFEGCICKLPAGLTLREIEVVKLVAQDMPNKQIADHLGICTETVAVHIRNIERKTGAASKNGVVAFAYQNNIL